MDIKYFNFFTGYTKEKMMRVSNRRMLKMNFSFLMSIFGIYRSACLFNRRHPLHKYLNSFTPHVRLLPYNKAQKLKLEKMYPVFSKILKKIIKKKKNFEHKKKKMKFFTKKFYNFMDLIYEIVNYKDMKSTVYFLSKMKSKKILL